MKSCLKTLASLFLLGSMMACQQTTQNASTEIAAPVSVLEVVPGSIQTYLSANGTAMSASELAISSEMAGEYQLQVNPSTGTLYKMGDRVKKGAVIVRFSDQEYLNGISIETKKLNLEIAESDLEKQKSLYEKGGVTQTDVRNAEVKLASSKIDFENGQLRLDKMEVKAPFDGVITELPHYTQNARLNSGSALFSMMDYSKMYMEINLPESAIMSVTKGQNVLITHYTLPGDTLIGKISELSPAISSETRTFKSKLVVDNPKLLIRPGMFVKADIVVASADSTIVIEKSLVISNRGRKFVYVVEQSTARMRQIQTGLEDSENVEILSGLNVGDQLVIKGYETLRDNAKVKVLK